MPPSLRALSSNGWYAAAFYLGIVRPYLCLIFWLKVLRPQTRQGWGRKTLVGGSSLVGQTNTGALFDTLGLENVLRRHWFFSQISFHFLRFLCLPLFLLLFCVSIFSSCFSIGFFNFHFEEGGGGSTFNIMRFFYVCALEFRGWNVNKSEVRKDQERLKAAIQYLQGGKDIKSYPACSIFEWKAQRCACEG